MGILPEGIELYWEVLRFGLCEDGMEKASFPLPVGDFLESREET